MTILSSYAKRFAEKRGNREGLDRASDGLQRPSGKRVVTYSRVSSRAQESEGFSLPAQRDSSRKYAKAKNFTIAAEFEDVETARKPGRTNFGAMIRFIQANPDIKAIIVDHTDRLYRNQEDRLLVEELGIDIHFIREGVVLSHNSRSADHLILGVKVEIAKYESNLRSERTIKGMMEKARQGLWPNDAPIGYMHGPGRDNREALVVDPDVGPVIAKMFEWYVSGGYSIAEVARKARREGLVGKKTRLPITTSSVRTILQNPFYTGWFIWKGRWQEGKHDPIISFDLWERAQKMKDKRRAGKLRRGKQDLAYSRLVSCERCGCAVVGEIKKHKFVYYHVTGCETKCLGDPKSCRRKYVREADLDEFFLECLGTLNFDPDVQKWWLRLKLAGHADELRERETAIEKLGAECKRLGKRLKNLHRAKYDGEIEDKLFRELAAECQEEQFRCLRDIEHHRKAVNSCRTEGTHLPEFRGRLASLIKSGQSQIKRQLLNTVFEKCTWKDGRLECIFRRPFNLLVKSDAAPSQSMAHRNS